MKRAGLLAVMLFATAATLVAQSNGHPDLSGTWLFSIDLPPVALKRQTNGSTSVKSIDASGAKNAANASVPGALPSQPAPVYKPEFRAKVKDLSDHESRTDEVF